MKGKKILLAVLLTLVFCLAASGAALAMSSSNYNLPWQMLATGGGGRSSSSYVLGDTSGQPRPPAYRQARATGLAPATGMG